MENLPPDIPCDEGEAGVISGLIGSVKVMDVGRLGDCRLNDTLVVRGDVGSVDAERAGGMICSAGGPDDRDGNGTDGFDSFGGDARVASGEEVKCDGVAEDRRGRGGEGAE